MARSKESFFMLGTSEVPDWPAVVLVKVTAGVRWETVQRAIKRLLREKNGGKPVGWGGIFIWAHPGGETHSDLPSVRKEQSEFFHNNGQKYTRYVIDADGMRQL